MTKIISHPQAAANSVAASKNSPSFKPKPGLLTIDAFDLLERIADIGYHWKSIIDSVLEAHHLHAHMQPTPIEPLPQWALERLSDQGRNRSSEIEHQHKLDLLEDWLHLAAGNGSQYRFEVWTSSGTRLACRHQSLEEAAAILEQLKPLHPEAFIARVHVLSGGDRGLANDPALLETLIGKVSYIGTHVGDGEEQYTVQDETGRQVTVAASVLAKHPVHARLEKRCKDSLAFYLNEYKARQEAIRTAASEQKVKEQQ